MANPAKSQKYFDQRIKGETVFVLPGHHFVQSDSNTPISTLLGSCVAACIRDTASKAGGLNHFLLPDGSENSDEFQSSRYGVNAMEVLINDLLKMGAQKKNLEAKVFGGAQVIQTSSMEAVGTQNGEFVKGYLRSEEIPILAEDLGGESPRRIYFFPATGKVSVLRIPSAASDEIRNAELEMRKRAIAKSRPGGVELF